MFPFSYIHFAIQFLLIQEIPGYLIKPSRHLHERSLLHPPKTPDNFEGQPHEMLVHFRGRQNVHPKRKQTNNNAQL